jgi:hypothetical protein
VQCWDHVANLVGSQQRHGHLFPLFHFL